MGRDSAPAREISFVSLVAYGPKVSHSALTIGVFQLVKPGRVVPNNTHLGKDVKLVIMYLILQYEYIHQLPIVTQE